MTWLPIRTPGGEPAGEHAEVRGTVAAPAPATPFIERGDRSQQLRDRRSCPRSQQFGLRGFVAGTEEPAPKASPAFAPCIKMKGLSVGPFLRIAGGGVACIARRHLRP